MRCYEVQKWGLNEEWEFGKVPVRMKGGLKEETDNIDVFSQL